MTRPLGELCGPHCATKDGVTGHCQECHRIKGEFDAQMRAHENINRERQQWARDGANARASGS